MSRETERLDEVEREVRRVRRDLIHTQLEARRLRQLLAGMFLLILMPDGQAWAMVLVVVAFVCWVIGSAFASVKTWRAGRRRRARLASR